MGRSLYQLPTLYLVEQGFLTSHELRVAAAGAAAEDWRRAGVDVAALARDVDAAFRALWDAQTTSLLAGVEVRVEQRFTRDLVTEAHTWALWLLDVLDEAAAQGATGLVLTPRRALRRSTPGLPSLTERMRSLVADVARERATLLPYAGDEALLDRGAVHLGELVEAALRERDAARARAAATAAELEARRRFVEVFRGLDRAVARAKRVLGVPPPGGASRAVLRAEARRRDAADRHRRAAPRAMDMVDAAIDA